MEFKKIILYIVCLVLLMNAGKTLWELINFSSIAILYSNSASFDYKGGYVIGVVIKSVGYIGLVKFIYDRFLKIKVPKLV